MYEPATRYRWTPWFLRTISIIAWSVLVGGLFIAFIIAFPTGVLAALYLEEYAPKNRWTDLIEVSINNLAAVPSIIFGLLALAVFLLGPTVAIIDTITSDSVAGRRLATATTTGSEVK